DVERGEELRHVAFEVSALGVERHDHVVGASRRGAHGHVAGEPVERVAEAGGRTEQREGVPFLDPELLRERCARVAGRHGRTVTRWRWPRACRAWPLAAPAVSPRTPPP